MNRTVALDRGCSAPSSPVSAESRIDTTESLFGSHFKRLLQQNRHIATFRGDAAIQSLSERSGHSASRTYRAGFMSTRPNRLFLPYVEMAVQYALCMLGNGRREMLHQG